MEQVVQQAAANSEETSSASEELASQAQGLAAMVGSFQLSRGGSRGSARTVSAAKPAVRRAPPIGLPPVKKGKNGSNGKGLSVRPEDLIPLDSDADFQQF